MQIISFTRGFETQNSGLHAHRLHVSCGSMIYAGNYLTQPVLMTYALCSATSIIQHYLFIEWIPMIRTKRTTWPLHFFMWRQTPFIREFMLPGIRRRLLHITKVIGSRFRAQGSKVINCWFPKLYTPLFGLVLSNYWVKHGIRPDCRAILLLETS